MNLLELPTDVLGEITGGYFNDLDKFALSRTCRRTAERYTSGMDLTLYDYATSADNITMLQWLRDIGCQWDALTFATAAVYASQDTLEWLDTAGCPKDSRAIIRLIIRGDIDLIKWAITHGITLGRKCDITGSRIGELRSICKRNRVNKQNILLLNDPGFMAAKYGHLHILEWLSRDCEQKLGNWYHRAAASRGHLHVIKWLRDQNVPIDECTIRSAVKHAHINVLEWFRARGWNDTLGSEVFTVAAGNNRIDMLEWLKANGFNPLTDGTVYYRAAKRGHIEAIKWLYAEGCTADHGACLGAVKGNQLNTLKWLVELGFPLCPLTFHHVLMYGYGSNEILELLYAAGCPFDVSYVYRWAADQNRPDILDWLHSKNIRVPRDLIRIAVANKSKYFLPWLVANGYAVTISNIAASYGLIP